MRYNKMANNEKHVGSIYILTNPSFPEYVKIGYADDVEQRVSVLNNSASVPFAFRVYATYDVDTKLSDKKLHSILDTLNPDLRSIDDIDGKQRKREFFALEAEDAYKILEAIAVMHGLEDRLHKRTPSPKEKADEKAAEELKKKSKVPFSALGIPVGAKLGFIKDSAITCEVVDDSHVSYDGQTMSLSALGKQLLGYKHSVQGPFYFTYNGKTLVQIREEIGK
ncbi:hypothetical protein FACS1894211_06570 [Clostridia bacterium]|nr:hypothetical protein FACS1894211_06570 [Clostridia bacterium]